MHSKICLHLLLVTELQSRRSGADMRRTSLALSLSFLTSTIALPQAQSSRTAQNVLSDNLADLRGVSEIVDGAGTERRNEKSALWFSIVAGPGGQADIRLPAGVGSSAGLVSASRLRHPLPKAARQAYERAARTQDAKKAANDLEIAVRIDPDFAEAHDDLGVAYTRLGRYAEGVAEFRRAAALVPEESLPYSNLAWVLFVLGQRAEAEANARRAVQLGPGNAPAHFLMGRLLIDAPQTLAEGLWHLEYAARTIPEAKQLAKRLEEHSDR